MGNVFEELIEEGENRYGVSVCFRCKYCVASAAPDWMPICPSYEYFGFNNYGGGRVQVARGLATGTIEFNEEIAESVYRCTNCGACVDRCFNMWLCGEDFNPVVLTEVLRQESVRRGFGPGEKQAANLKKLREKHNPYGKEHGERLDCLEGRGVPAQAETAFFVGCTGSYVEQELARSTAAILEAAGEDFTVTGDEWCCGSYALRLGDTKQGEELARHNVEVWKNIGAKRVVTQCPGCYRTLLKDYDSMGIDTGVEVLHITQYLAQLLDGGDIKLKQVGKGKKVTYHDPCHLGRHCGIYEEPRKVIGALGYELTEMPRNRETAWCCGAGGGVKSGYPDFALWTAKERIREAVDTGADVLLTSCPFCELNLREAAQELGEDIEVADLNDPVLRALEGG